MYKSQDLLTGHDFHIAGLFDAHIGVETLVGHSRLDDLALMLDLHLNGCFIQAIEVRRLGFNEMCIRDRRKSICI